MGCFRGTVLFWSPAVKMLQSFYFKENTRQFYSLISHFASLTPTIYLRGSVSFFFPSVPPSTCATEKKKQMSVQN